MDQHHFLHHHHHYPHAQEHRTTRYTSLTALQSHHHHHHNLPPPPAPPPPLSYHRAIHTPPPPQPYTPPTPQPQQQQQHQHQQFPFNHHHTPLPHRPLEEEPRPLPYDLLPRRTTLPWNPNPRTAALHDDFDREFHHHRPPPPQHPPIEPLRYDRTDRAVVHDPYEQNPSAWGGGNYHAPSQGDVEPKPSGNYFRVYSVECDADVANRSSRVESKRWLMSDRERGRELHHESSSNLVNNGSNNSEKYYHHHGSDVGRYSRGNSRECGHEFARTPPKKQVQKKSALLRIQTVKPNNNNNNNHRNREVEQLRYPGYGSECGTGFFRGKEQYLGHGVKGEEREGSPVEIDISFESNSLVAKAIVAPPSSSASFPDLNVTPVSDSDLGYGERSRRVSGSDGDCSGLQPVRVSSVIVDLNRSPCKGNDSSSSGKEVSVQKNVDDGSSQACAWEADDSRGKKEVPSSVKVGSVCSGKSTPRIVKKKKIVKRVVKKATGNSKSAVANSKSAVQNSLPANTLPEKIETNLEEKSTTVHEVCEPDCLYPLPPKEGNVLKEDTEGGSSLLSLEPDSRLQECKSDKDSDIGKLSRFESDGNISNSPSCASSCEAKKSDSDCLDANNSVHDNGSTISVHDNTNTSDCLGANNSVPNTDKVTKSLNGSTISEVNYMDNDNKLLCQNEVSLSPGKYSSVGSPQNRNLVDVGGELFKAVVLFQVQEKLGFRMV
ncbi:hypothetical protein E2542_SST20535 [Spatholobus suberectus]|nr:hypothetical protein E2542_SST20535 [Spatholobus suberectus]